MKIDIKAYERKQGFIKKTTYYHIDTKVVFSEEEQAIIDTHNLGPKVIMERPAPSSLGSADVWTLTIKGLANGDSYNVDTPARAAAYQTELRNVLVQLKEYIESQKQGAEDQSFEL